ncbi:hypothetical protein HWV62_4744 [Athelia sp. TMB]|nr:hypothetical protein HWV62_4744 [Athelia sp. TMB]
MQPQATPHARGRDSRQRSTHTVRAPYSPPCIRDWVQQQDPQPKNQDIAAERHRRRFNIHFDQQEYPASAGQNFLHPHFCLNREDRLWAWHEGVSDIQDAVTGMGRLADVVHIGFSVRPEWNTVFPLKLESIHIVPTVSRQIEQMDGWAGAVSKMEEIFRREIALPHIIQYRTKLNQIQPPPGYTLDDETRSSIHHPIRLHPSVEITPHMSSSSSSAPATSSVPSGTSHLPASQTPPSVTQQIPLLASPTPAPRSIPTLTPIAEPLQPQGQLNARGGQQTETRVPHPRLQSPFDYPVVAAVPPSRPAASSSNLVRPPTAARRDHGDRHRVPRNTSSQRPQARTSQTLVSQELIEIGTDSSEEEQPEHTAGTLRIPRPQRESMHWLHTPPGTPPRISSMIGSPPSYYTDPGVTAFGFPPDVVEFLQETVHANARALCIIDVTRGCEIECWRARFVEAGLSLVDAQQLEDLLVQALPLDLRAALLASSSQPASPTSPSATESSIEDDEDEYWSGMKLGDRDTYWESV